jgi:predicted DNA-binding transcriptional regulator AlpA
MSAPRPFAMGSRPLRRVRGELGDRHELDETLPPVLDLPHAAALLGVGRTTAYRLVHEQQWPTPVLRLGRLIKIPTKPLLDLLAGATADQRDLGAAGAVPTHPAQRVGSSPAIQ